MKIKLMMLAVMSLLLTRCSEAKLSVLEVTSFKLKTTANAAAFNKMDAEIEAKFTSKQPGFIKRQSGINEHGEYVVLVYWNTIEDASASMKKFMKDQSVMTYASMIDASTMKMTQYTIHDNFKAHNK